MKALEALLFIAFLASMLALTWGIVDGTPNGDYAIQCAIGPFLLLFVFFAVLLRPKRKN